MTFTVIDNQTGQPPDLEQIALTEAWAKDLTYCHLDGFALHQDGFLVLLDKCGNFRYCPAGRFRVEIKE